MPSGVIVPLTFEGLQRGTATQKTTLSQDIIKVESCPLPTCASRMSPSAACTR